MFDLADEERLQGHLVPAIMRGALAGALAELSRSDELVRAGLAKSADFHSGKAKTLLAEGMTMVREGVGAPPPHYIQMPVSSRVVRPINSLAMDSRLSSRSSSAP